MQALRALTHRYRLLAVLLVVCALAVKAAIPAGYMLGQQGTVLTVEICADASGGAVTKQIVIPHSGVPTEGKAADGKAAHDQAPAPCPYAALGLAALTGADAVLLGLALALILALGLAPAPSAPLRPVPFLRPPLRGPPAFA